MNHRIDSDLLHAGHLLTKQDSTKSAQRLDRCRMEVVLKKEKIRVD